VATVRKNLRPFLLIQAGAALTVAAYYLIPPFGALADRAGELKSAGGMPAAALATIFASLVVPEVARGLTGQRERVDGRELLFRAVFFATIGLIVDTLYPFFGRVFGPRTDPLTVLWKVLADQFLFSPLVSIPITTMAFLWRDSRFSLASLLARLKAGEFPVRYAPTMVLCWGFWLPTLVAVYAVPVRLQFVLYLFTQAAWSLLIVHMDKEGDR
jgi:hypothetical protein